MCRKIKYIIEKVARQQAGQLNFPQFSLTAKSIVEPQPQPEQVSDLPKRKANEDA